MAFLYAFLGILLENLLSVPDHLSFLCLFSCLSLLPFLFRLCFGSLFVDLFAALSAVLLIALPAVRSCHYCCSYHYHRCFLLQVPFRAPLTVLVALLVALPVAVRVKSNSCLRCLLGLGGLVELPGLVDRLALVDLAVELIVVPMIAQMIAQMIADMNAMWEVSALLVAGTRRLEGCPLGEGGVSAAVAPNAHGGMEQKMRIDVCMMCVMRCFDPYKPWWRTGDSSNGLSCSAALRIRIRSSLSMISVLFFFIPAISLQRRTVYKFEK